MTFPVGLVTSDTFTRVIVPISTFFLGAASAWLLKIFELRKARIQQEANARKMNVQSVFTLVNEWYDQIVLLRNAVVNQPQAKATEEAVFNYVHNRYQLPKLLLALDQVRNEDGNQAFVEAVQDFLSLVTTYGETRETPAEHPFADIMCVDPSSRNFDWTRLGLGSDWAGMTPAGHSYDSLIETLDKTLKRITASASACLCEGASSGQKTGLQYSPSLRPAARSSKG